MQLASDEESIARYRELGYRFNREPIGHSGQSHEGPILLGSLRACDVRDPLRRAAAWGSAVIAALITDTHSDQILSDAGFVALPEDLSGGGEERQPRFLWLRRAAALPGPRAAAAAPAAGDKLAHAGDSEDEDARVEEESGPLLDLWVGPEGQAPVAPGFQRLSAPVNAHSAEPPLFLWTRSLGPGSAMAAATGWLAGPRDGPASADGGGSLAAIEEASAGPEPDGGLGAAMGGCETEETLSTPVMRDAAFAGVALPPLPARALVPPAFVRRRVAVRARAEFSAALRVREAAAQAWLAQGQASLGDLSAPPAGSAPARRQAGHIRARASAPAVAGSVNSSSMSEACAAGDIDGFVAEADPLWTFLLLLRAACDADRLARPPTGTALARPAAANTGLGPSISNDGGADDAGSRGGLWVVAGGGGDGFTTPAGFATLGTPAGHFRGGDTSIGGLGQTPGGYTMRTGLSSALHSRGGFDPAASGRRGSRPPRPVRLPTFMGTDFTEGLGDDEATDSPGPAGRTRPSQPPHPLHQKAKTDGDGAGIADGTRGGLTAAELRRAARRPVTGLHAEIAAAGGTLSRDLLLFALSTSSLGLCLTVSLLLCTVCSHAARTISSTTRVMLALNCVPLWRICPSFAALPPFLSFHLLPSPSLPVIPGLPCSGLSRGPCARQWTPEALAP